MSFFEELLGSKYKEDMTITELQALLSSDKNIKLVNLKNGGYVAKEKYDKAAGELKTISDDLPNYDKLKKDYETASTELATLKQEKVDNDRLSKISSKVKKDFSEFVYSKVKDKIDDKNPIDSVVEEYLKENPQFKNENETDNPKSKAVFKNKPINNGEPNTENNVNKEMNDFIRESVQR